MNAQQELNDQQDDFHPTSDAIIFTCIQGAKTLIILGCILSLYLHLFY